MRKRNIKEIEESQKQGWDNVFNVFALYFVLCPLQLLFHYILSLFWKLKNISPYERLEATPPLCIPPKNK